MHVDVRSFAKMPFASLSLMNERELLFSPIFVLPGSCKVTGGKRGCLSFHTLLIKETINRSQGGI